MGAAYESSKVIEYGFLAFDNNVQIPAAVDIKRWIITDRCFECPFPNDLRLEILRRIPAAK